MPEENKQQQPPRLRHEDFMKDPYFARWYPKWIENAMLNYPIIKKEFDEKDRCATCLPRPMNRPCLILGSGPTLDNIAPLLKDWKNPIFSSTSTAFVPLRHGRKPDFMCAFDSLWSTYNEHLMLDKKFSWNGTTLLTHPNAEPQMIKAWKWDKYYYRRVFPGHEFFEFTFPLMFPQIKIGIRFSGCVVNNAVTLAIFLGFNPIILSGVDFGWKDDTRTKATNWKPTKNGEWEMVPNIPVDKVNHKYIVTEEGIHTHPEYYGFKAALLGIYASQNEIEIIDASDGLLSEFPKVSPEEIVRTQGWGDYGIDRQKNVNKINEYYAKLNSGGFEWQKEEQPKQ
jgi:hypothetical protein